jgi:hypothetical protein
VSAPVLTAAWRPQDWPVRTLRSLAAAVVCTLTAALAHLGAGGTVSAGALAVVLLGSAAVAGTLSARRLTAGQLVGMVVLAQLTVHLVAHLGDTAPAMTMSAGMVVAHAVATAASAVLLTRGEGFLWVLADRLGLRAVPLLRAATVLPSGEPAPARPRVASRREALLAHTRVERGPPVGFA